MTGTSSNSATASGGDAQSASVLTGLEALIRHEIPSARDIAFSNVVRAAGGLSRENWSLDAQWTDDGGRQSRELMLMRDTSGTLLNTERGREFAVLKALEGTPVPAPMVYWMDAQGRWLGAPSVVMKRMPGSCDYMVLNGKRPLEERKGLAHSFIKLMSDIHAIDWKGRGLGDALGVPQTSPAHAELVHWEAEYRRCQLEPHPEMDYILAWLKRRAPQTQAMVLVHGDFKPGNALVLGKDISAKLDWETAHLGDPLEDLGWVTNPTRKREHQIPGEWERREIVEAYAKASGREVNEAALYWWNVLACWKLSVIQLTAVGQFVAGRYDRVFQTPSWLYRPMFKMMEAAG